MKNALIIFIKNPRIGNVKTRLAATVGDVNALNIYKQLIKHTQNISLAAKADRFLFYDDFIQHEDEWEKENFTKLLQKGNNLGERMNNSFDQILSKYNKATIIGSDCFDLTAFAINNAFQFLDDNDVVIGPASDGGYYLLGLKKNHPFLFENILWSTPQVLKQTITICKKKKLKYFLLPTLSDIDVEDDLTSDQKKNFLENK